MSRVDASACHMLCAVVGSRCYCGEREAAACAVSLMGLTWDCCDLDPSQRQ